jgi:D-alanyl-D-alanine carboxypeptidase (penicillin-binding protein 5/6)
MHDNLPLPRRRSTDRFDVDHTMIRPLYRSIRRAGGRSRFWLRLAVVALAGCSTTTDSPRDTTLGPLATPRMATVPVVTTTDTATDTATATTASTTPPTSTEAPLPPITTEPTTTVDPSALPAVDAAAYAVLDVPSGRWLAEADADAPRSVGSLMKLLTARAVLLAGEPERIVTVPAMQLDPEESIVGLYEGERLPRDVLFRAMMIASANDAARALANDIGGGEESAFVELMNSAAADLGLAGTHAVNATGLDAPGAVSTARDMVTLTAELMNDPTLRAAVAQASAQLHGQTFPNRNQLLTTYTGAIGAKTGSTTAAGSCVIAVAERDGRTMIVAVLGASTNQARFDSATKLLDWAFAQP